MLDFLKFLKNKINKNYPRLLELRATVLTRKSFGSRLVFFNRIVELTGLGFNPNIFKKFEGFFPFFHFSHTLFQISPFFFLDQSVWKTEPFDYLDLIEIGDRVKCMDIVSLSQGNFFLYKALSRNDWRTQRTLLIKVLIYIYEWYLKKATINSFSKFAIPIQIGD